MKNERTRVRVNEGENFTKKATRLRWTTVDFLLNKGCPENLLKNTPYSIMTFGKKSWLEGVVFVGFTGIKHGKIDKSPNGVIMSFTTDQDSEEDVVERTLSFKTNIGYSQVEKSDISQDLPVGTALRQFGRSEGQVFPLTTSYLAYLPKTDKSTIKKGMLIVFSDKVLHQLNKKSIYLGQEVGLITKTESKQE